MATTMYILGWRAEGLRCPDHEINFCGTTDNNPFPITLIQMPNGTGKTTTLTLLRAALSGVTTGEWPSDKVLELKKKGQPDQEGGLFELRLALNDERITIRMEFDFKVGLISYKTTQRSGQEDGFKPPPELHRFMNSDFVNFYVFDGELAHNLLNPEHTKAEKAIESLFQIHLLHRMKDKISDYWDDRTRNVTAKNQTGYQRRKNQLDKWKERLSILEEEKGELENKLAETEGRLHRQREKYEKEMEKNKEQAEKIKEAETTVETLEKEKDRCANGVLDQMRDPHAISPVFANKMFVLKTSLDRVKLPESAAREFFEELVEESECVCGREIDDNIRQAILARAGQYLGSEDVSLLNTMKSAIYDAVSESPEKPSKDLVESVQLLSEQVNNLHGARHELDELKMEAESSDPDVERAEGEIIRLEENQRKIKSELQRFDGTETTTTATDPKLIYGIETIKKGIAELEEQVAEVTRTRDLRQKRDVLGKILDSAYSKARETIIVEICEQTNERIKELMPYNNVRIEKIERCLKLHGQSGGSVGETLSVSYAFLSTLFNRSGQHKLPFVVDSPVNPIDYEIRASIGTIVPQLTDQFIAFMISSEREKFLDSMRKCGNQQIQYLTLLRKGIGHPLEMNAQTQDETSETTDGLLVRDKEFFEKFQMDDAEDI